MATIVVQYALRFDRKNEISDTDKTSKGLVQLEIYFDRKRIYKSTGFRLTRSEWDYKKNRPKDPILNRKLETIISEFRAFEDEFRAKNKTFALTDFQ